MHHVHDRPVPTRCSLSVLLIALAFLGFATPAALAQNADDDFKPFTGVVTGDDVYVRAGPSQRYYDIMQLDRGAIIEVRDNLHGWYEIGVPDGSFSWISQQYVEPDAEGNTGTVTGNNVRVRAPSPAGPGRDKSYKSQTSLDTGEKVTILGEAPGWYKIVPPDDASAFIHSDYVKRATQADLRAARQAADTTADAGDGGQTDAGGTDVASGDGTSGDAATEGGDADGAVDAGDTEATGTQVVDAADGTTTADAGGTTDDGEATATTDAGETGEDSTGETVAADTEGQGEEGVTGDDGTGEATMDAGGTETAAADGGDAEPAIGDRAVDQALAALEERFAEASRKQLIDQPVDTLLAAYEAMLQRESLTEQQRAIAEMRVELLRTRLNLKQTIVELKQAQTELEAERAAEGGGADAGEGEAPTRAANYTAVGRLLASSLYTGDRLPKLYRLVDPLSDMTIGYVKPSDEPNTRRMLGRVVGIVGNSRYHPGLKLKIITVDKIDPLAAQR